MLELIDVTCSYGGIEIIRGASLEVPKGKIIAVAGDTGAGKTTFIRAAAGLQQVASGQILYDGADIAKQRPNGRVKRGMAFVPQGEQMFDPMTVSENLQSIAEPRKNGRRLIDSVFELFPELTSIRHRRAILLSTGQRHQLAIARALISEPRLLVIDGPTPGVNSQTMADVEKAVAELSEHRGLTVLITGWSFGPELTSVARCYSLRAGELTSDESGRVLG